MPRSPAALIRYVPFGETVAVTIPYHVSGLSKNAQHAVATRRVVLRADAQAAREALGWELKICLQGRVFHPQHKVWISVFVQRQDMKSDPINVLDAVADAVKEVIGVDDRWFAVDRLDWALVRHQRPFVRIRLWQDADPSTVSQEGSEILCQIGAKTP